MKDNLFDELNNKEVEQVTRKTVKRNDIDSAQTNKSYDIPDVDRKQKNLLKVYRNEPKVSVRIAPSYAKYFGKTMRVMINGIAVTVRCDGRAVNVPETFAAEIYRRMDSADAYEMKTSKMSNYTKNYETAPGLLNFFG